MFFAKRETKHLNGGGVCILSENNVLDDTGLLFLNNRLLYVKSFEFFFEGE